jgi:hypothetical protein
MKLDARTQNYHCHFWVTDICRKTSGKYEHTGLISRLRKPVPVPETPGTEGVPDSEAEKYQGAVFLQKVIKGHVIQTLVHIVMTLFPACLSNFFVQCL